MIVWNGYGFLVVIIDFFCLLFTEKLVESLTGNDQFYQENSWAIFLGFTLASGVVWLLCNKLEKIKGRLFFVEVKKWWWINLVIGAGMWLFVR